jgi:hypothetical protein
MVTGSVPTPVGEAEDPAFPVAVESGAELLPEVSADPDETEGADETVGAVEDAGVDDDEDDEAEGDTPGAQAANARPATRAVTTVPSRRRRVMRETFM